MKEVAIVQIEVVVIDIAIINNQQIIKDLEIAMIINIIIAELQQVNKEYNLKFCLVLMEIVKLAGDLE